MNKTSGESLKVLNPRGDIDTTIVQSVSPRVSNLEGKKIGFYWNGKPDGDYF